MVIDAFNDPRFTNVIEYIHRRGTRSIAYFPSRYDVSSIGILSVGSVEVKKLRNFEISAFKEVSKQLSAALQECRLKNERNKAIAELSKRERELKSLLENTPDIIFRWNTDFQYTFINKAAETVVGLTEEDFLGKKIAELPLEKPNFWVEIATRVLKTGTSEVLEYSSQKGKVYLVNIIPEFDSSNDVCSLLFIGRDITDRKEAENSLRQSEERFRAFMDNIPHRAFIKDENGKYVYINKALKEFAEEISSEILFKTDSEWLPEEYAEKLRNVDQQVLSGEEQIETIEVVKTNEKLHSYLSNKFLLKNHKGEKFIGGVAVDITERIEAEELIRENEARFRAIFETAGIGIVLVSPTGYILKTNPSFERIMGYSGEELSLMHFKEFTHPDDVGVSLDLFRKLSDSQTGHYVYDKRYVRKNGDIIWAKAAASMVKDATGKPMYIIGTVEDVTEQRRYTEHLKKLTEELGFKNEELKLAKENAENANKAKSVFLSSMSHELRTPLNAILGFAQILKKDNSIAPRQRNFIETMYKSGTHLLDMINDVLDISKIESGNMELFPDELNVKAILSDTHDMFNHPAREKGLLLSVSYSPDVPDMMYGDAKRLRQILLNLLSNAVKFTLSGRISLHVTAQRETDDMAICTFTVKDTGRGIPEDHFEIIFEPFRQIAGMYSEGSGLGLAISRRIAGLMNGTISVSSTVDKGSVFTFTVPLKILKAGEHNGTNSAQAQLLKRGEAQARNNEKRHFRAIADDILRLPEHFSNALADAVEVQDTGAIDFILNEALQAYPEAITPLLKQLETAARASDFRTLTYIGEILYKLRSNRP
jgi:PAS domain S-box-containing protein